MLRKEDIEQLKKIHKDQRGKKIVFASGSFDLPHAGHVLFLEDCKRIGDVLVVFVGSDEIIRARKGEGRPILNEHVRLKTILSFKPVDYCFLDNTRPDEEALDFIDEVFEHLKPAVYVINEDAFNIPYRERLSQKHNVEMVILNRVAPPEFDGISTTKLIEKIRKSLD